jgi:hypothetical protein
MIRALAALALLVAAAAAPAAAEHVLHLRYTVLGYVRDAAGKPVAGQRVEVVRDKTGFSYVGETDAAGLFIVIARLGDESAGERLTVRIGDQRLGVVANFDAANHTDERGTRVDVDGARLMERPAWFRSTLVKLLSEPKP